MPKSWRREEEEEEKGGGADAKTGAEGARETISRRHGAMPALAAWSGSTWLCVLYPCPSYLLQRLPP